MQVVWLTGDYVNKRERQRLAGKLNCDLVIEFHFNASNNTGATGAEVWYRIYSLYSRRLAEILLDRMVQLGLRRRGVKPATSQSRAAFINSYPPTCLTVLLEPAFVTNKQDASRLHDPTFMKRLATAISDGIKAFAEEIERFRPLRVVGLSVGHIGKGTEDKGARCVFGDYEADHAKELADLVYDILNNPTDGR